MTKSPPKKFAVPIDALAIARDLRAQLRAGQPLNERARLYLRWLVWETSRGGGDALRRFPPHSYFDPIAARQTLHRDAALAEFDALAADAGVPQKIRHEKIAAAFPAAVGITAAIVKNAAQRFAPDARECVRRVKADQGEPGIHAMGNEAVDALVNQGADEQPLLELIRPD